MPEAMWFCFFSSSVRRGFSSGMGIPMSPGLLDGSGNFSAMASACAGTRRACRGFPSAGVLGGVPLGLYSQAASGEGQGVSREHSRTGREISMPAKKSCHKELFETRCLTRGRMGR